MKKIYLLITAIICLAACKSGPFQKNKKERDEILKEGIKNYSIYYAKELDSLTEVTLLQVDALPLKDFVKYQTDNIELRIEIDRYAYLQSWNSIEQYYGKISIDSLRQIKNDTLKQVLDYLDKLVLTAEKRKKQIDSLNKLAVANPKDFGGYRARAIVRIDLPFPKEPSIDTSEFIMSKEGKVLVEP